MFLLYSQVNRGVFFYLGLVNNHRYAWTVVFKSMFLKQRVHTDEPFNFDAIFHRLRTLSHKSEPNQNPRKNGTKTKEIVLRFSVISVTRDSPNYAYSTLITLY